MEKYPRGYCSFSGDLFNSLFAALSGALSDAVSLSPCAIAALFKTAIQRDCSRQRNPRFAWKKMRDT
jgi:hypothetical protein